MKNGTRVDTELGPGTITGKEMDTRYCVKLDSCPDKHIDIQNKYGGLYFWKSEIKIIKQKKRKENN